MTDSQQFTTSGGSSGGGGGGGPYYFNVALAFASPNWVSTVQANVPTVQWYGTATQRTRHGDRYDRHYWADVFCNQSLQLVLVWLRLHTAETQDMHRPTELGRGVDSDTCRFQPLRLEVQQLYDLERQ